MFLQIPIYGICLHQMLTEAIMHACLCKLIKDRDEESLECLCQLLTTIGKDIDHEKAKVLMVSCWY